MGTEITALKRIYVYRCMKGSLLNLLIEELRHTALIHEDMLHKLEVLEELDYRLGSPVSASFSAAYCAVAVECTLKYLGTCSSRDVISNKSAYVNAINGIWRGHIPCMESSSSSGVGCRLYTAELKRWRDDIEASLSDPMVLKRLESYNGREDAIWKLKLYLLEASANLAPYFDEIALFAALYCNNCQTHELDGDKQEPSALAFLQRVNNRNVGELPIEKQTTEAPKENLDTEATFGNQSTEPPNEENEITEEARNENQTKEAPSEIQTTESRVENMITEEAPSEIQTEEALIENQTSEALIENQITKEASNENQTKEALIENQISEALIENMITEETPSEIQTEEALIENQTSEALIEDMITEEAPSEIQTEEALIENQTTEALIENQITKEASDENQTKETLIENQTTELIENQVTEEVPNENRTEESPIENQIIEEALDENQTKESPSENQTTEALIENQITIEASDENQTKEALIENQTTELIENQVTEEVPNENPTEESPIENLIIEETLDENQTKESPSENQTTEALIVNQITEEAPNENQTKEVPIHKIADALNENQIAGAPTGNVGADTDLCDQHGFATASAEECNESEQSLDEGASDHVTKFHLPSPKKWKISPLRKYEPRDIIIRRKKKRWSEFEEITLRAAVNQYGEGNWKLILSTHMDVFEERTDVDLKDKWRNLKHHRAN
ncbi:uncharacterized protein LOC130960826 [Arachis stenosperma]|uniref:uncharacterized protein LOC130960826 n=1 Tax=Arachis stenosperma TaxID=217475 RepID=UPI0025AC6A9F|nr:uncharacterized protein LOC130960826 [Arachis stenosperma]